MKAFSWLSAGLVVWVCATSFCFLHSTKAAPSLSISGSNPVLLTWPTNIPSFALQTKTDLSPSAVWTNWLMNPVMIGTNYVATNTFTESSRLFRLSNWPQRRCESNLKQIVLAFKTWAGDNYGLFPFQLTTNFGGTKEFRAIGPDGFDTNAFKHFQVLSNYLVMPSVLVCLGDVSRIAAADFDSLKPENITYRLRTGDDVNINNDAAIIVVCPIDGNAGLCSGAVIDGTNY